MLKDLTQIFYQIGLSVHTKNSEDDRVPLLSYWCCAFTIHSIEQLLREEKKTMFSDRSSRKYNCLQALVRYVTVSSSVFNTSIIRSHCIRLLRYLLVQEQHDLNLYCCLDIDAFELLVSLIFTNQSLYIKNEEENEDPGCSLTIPCGNIFDQHFVKLILKFHLVQV